MPRDRDITSEMILLRHGETHDTLGQIVSGQRDTPLTDNGRQQAAQVAGKLARLGIDRIVCSDLRRAVDTATIIAGSLNLPLPSIDARLRERDWGAMQGTPRRPHSIESDRELPEGAEATAAFSERVCAALRSLRARTLVVTHAGPIRQALQFAGREATTLAPCKFVRVGVDSVVGGGSFRVMHTDGYVLAPGTFRGCVVYVSDTEDLSRIDEHSLVMLQQCSKSTAIAAMNLAGATINLTRSLTAHLTHGRVDHSPYAIATLWREGLPRDGDAVEICFAAPEIRRAREMLPDVPPAPAVNTETVGGKAAGLNLLVQHRLNVPEFAVISIDELAQWRESGDFEQRATRWIESQNFNPHGTCAVRSSVNIEDRAEDSMSGSFVSRLDCPIDEMVEAIREVEASTRSDEIRLRHEIGGLTELPRAAVVIQRMIRRPSFSGTIFIPAPRQSDTVLMEAVLGTTAAELMDGTTSPNLTATCDARGNIVTLETDALAGPLPTNLHPLVEQVLRSGLAIYHSTGRGDLEFAVDDGGQVWWLQARVLNEPVEMVDRRGFHPAAVAYYKDLAFQVCRANKTPSVFFRCFDISPGVFGYSVGIRHRDREFHRLIENDISHLNRVTEFGWQVEREMRECVASLNDRDAASVLKLLTLHGAVQLPFSIPIRSQRMDRFQSKSCDDISMEPLLEDFLDRIHSQLGEFGTSEELLSLLRIPIRTQATVESLRAKLSLLQAERSSDEQLLIGRIADLRDVPDVSPQAMENLRREFQEKISQQRRIDPGGIHLRSQMELLQAALVSGQRRRRALLQAAQEHLDTGDWHRLESYANYLEMKSETNETHCLYRGRCFVWFASVGFIG